MMTTTNPSGTAKKILVAEDEALTAEDLRDTLANLGHEVIAVVDTAEEAIAVADRQKPDLALLDIHLKGKLTGIDVANHLRRRLDIPAVFVTAHSDSKTLNEAGGSEPFGYVVKPFEETELRATIAMAAFRHAAEKRTRDMEAWLTAALGSIGDAVIATDHAGRISFLNASAELLTGWSRREAIGMRLADVFRVSREDGSDPLGNLFEKVSSSGVTFHLTEGYVLHTKDGSLLPIDDSVAPIRDSADTIIGVVVIFRDRSEVKRSQEERQKLEQKMYEAQRLESLGVMAGGIAHDFNNLMAAVQTNASMCLELSSVDEDTKECLDRILTASEQAAGLCRQMLAYAGKGTGQVVAVDLNRLVGETVRLLHLSTSSVASVALDLGEDIGCIQADASQMQQVVMNLVLNAAEAMKAGGGTITVRTSRRRVEAKELAQARIGNDLPPGEHAILEVADTGCGIPPEVLGRIFDPFFTTKFHGRGLGLATVLGIIRSHNAALLLDSEPGVGTKFRLLFRPSEAAAPASKPAPSKTAGWRGEGKVLVVDDQESVRSSVAMILRNSASTSTRQQTERKAWKSSWPANRSSTGSFCRI